MNEKLEAFRKRLREPEKKKRDWASWIGSPTAQLAAVLSLFNLFYSHAYYNDELTVVLSPSRVHSSGDSIEVELPRVTLGNSGTRAASVVGMHLRHVQPNSDSKRRLSCDNIERYGYSGDVVKENTSDFVPIVFESVILKPGDTIVRSIKFDENSSILFDVHIQKGSKSGTFALNDFNQKRTYTDKRWSICLTFNIAATDAFWDKPVQLGSDSDAEFDGEFNSREVASSSHTLVKRNNFWTSVGPVSRY
jgi:hypothetical protein